MEVISGVFILSKSSNMKMRKYMQYNNLCDCSSSSVLITLLDYFFMVWSHHSTIQSPLKDTIRGVQGVNI